MEDTPKSEWIVKALDLHERSLIRYATWILNDIECAREVVQETFLRLCREDPAHISGHLAQWLFTVCRNLAFDVRRKETRMAPLGQMEVGVAPGLDEKQTISEVLQVVQTLPKNQREVIYLKFQCDLSYKEISAITGHSVSSVGFLIHTGVHRVRRQMQGASPAAAPLQGGRTDA